MHLYTKSIGHVVPTNAFSFKLRYDVLHSYRFSELADVYDQLFDPLSRETFSYFNVPDFDIFLLGALKSFPRLLKELDRFG